MKVKNLNIRNYSFNVSLHFQWISTTILDRVVKEIKVIDDSLLKYGLADVRVGHVGLDRLKKIAQTAQILQQIPTLSVLVPFMEISSNQEYVVQRIKGNELCTHIQTCKRVHSEVSKCINFSELSSVGCMSDFKWNSGGNLHGKSWDESLPTDSAVSIVSFYYNKYLLLTSNIAQ